MQLLDAVNLILPKLGEHAVTSLDTRHPTLAVILPEIENELRQFLMKGWWFNEFVYTVYPDTEGFCALGTDTLSFIPDYPEVAVQRGSQLYNPTTLSFVFSEPVVGRVRQYVQFDLLPESAAQTVLYSALVTSYVSDIGLTQEVQMWQLKAAAAASEALAEHLRQRKYSTKSSARYQRLRAALRGA